MRIAKLFTFFVVTFSLITAPAQGEGGGTLLDEKVVKLLSDAVYEVVVEKPTTDSLQYEKPLPLDLLPYSVRMSKYIPIGSAFAIGPEEFVSAVHVVAPGIRSQYKGVYLRDKSGAVYAIDKVLKYSNRHDFILFNLKGKRSERHLKVNAAPQVNQRVFAVGNALGDGIVIRDGLYTSNSPEEEEGEWQYIRFSAAASPGNSGGPLVDKAGRVIGIVLGKSENENLNYALPIAELMKAKQNAGRWKVHGKYFIDNMDMSKFLLLDKEIALPKPFVEFNNEIIGYYDDFGIKSMEGFFADYRSEIFPQGAGSLKVLNNLYSATFPGLVMKGEDGNWDAYFVTEPKQADLGRNGFLAYGAMSNYLFLQLHKPDNIDSAALYSDPQMFMDMVLKGTSLSRSVGPEKIKIVSLGKAHEDYVFVDSYRRRWLVRTWLLEYTDEKLALFMLPVPGGAVAIARAAQTGRMDSGIIPDMKALTDFFYVSYYGNLKEWREFLAQKEILPAAFSSLDISFSYGKEFAYRSPRLSFSYGTDLMEITEKSDLKLLFGYYPDGSATVWDVGGVVVGEHESTLTSFDLQRRSRPPEELRDAVQGDWENLLKQKYPYNRTAVTKDGSTLIRGLVPSDRVDPAKAAVIYSIGYGRDGTVKEREMKAKLDKFLKKVTIKENLNP